MNWIKNTLRYLAYEGVPPALPERPLKLDNFNGWQE